MICTLRDLSQHCLILELFILGYSPGLVDELFRLACLLGGSIFKVRFDEQLDSLIEQVDSLIQRTMLEGTRCCHV